MTSTTVSAKTPLYSCHQDAKAMLVEFGGYTLPQQYTNIRDEHLAVRHRVGLFDLSHMGEVVISGEDALSSVTKLFANDARNLAPGKALYSVMCDQAGGIIDDVVIYRDSANEFMVVVNASCRAKDVAWMRQQLTGSVNLVDHSDEVALLALQGPKAKDLLGTLTAAPLAKLTSFEFIQGKVAGIGCRISRTGYTGEDGFELYTAAKNAEKLWQSLVVEGNKAGLALCGLGARDTLRLEAGLRLYGQDMDENVDPYSAGLGWTVKLKDHEFIGASALQGIRAEGPPHRFIGMTFGNRVIARHGCKVLCNGGPVGEITSGTYSFSREQGVATALVDRLKFDPDAALQVEIRGALYEATPVPLPFYKRVQSN